MKHGANKRALSRILPLGMRASLGYLWVRLEHLDLMVERCLNVRCWRLLPLHCNTAMTRRAKRDVCRGNMNDVWVISDTHFGHANILGFVESDGRPVREGFDDVHHMNEVMIENWNSVVKPDDKIYHLGDVAFGKQTLDVVMPRLNGQKRLILGNHDNLDARDYRKYFQKIASWRQVRFGDLLMVMCHYPLHESAFDNRHGKSPDPCGVCVHGHIHRKTLPDPRYINVCVEMTEYAPVNLDDLIKRAGALKLK